MSMEFHTEVQRRPACSGDMLSGHISEGSDLGGTMGTETARFVFEDVAQELSGPLRRYLERLVGNRATADDLVQETLVKIARALPGFEGRSSVKTWAFTIATRVATDHFRRPHSRAQMVEVDESAPVLVSDSEIDQRLVIDEMNSCVREVIDSLPEDYRMALVLHDLEGQTAAQTAEIVGCSLATAKIRIHRARLRLKEALNEQCIFYRDEEDVFRCDRKPDG
jgi:RNA polymerase sigma-70 factor (ECF subfamily)